MLIVRLAGSLGWGNLSVYFSAIILASQTASESKISQ